MSSGRENFFGGLGGPEPLQRGLRLESHRVGRFGAATDPPRFSLARAPGNQIVGTRSNRRLAALRARATFANAFRDVQNTPPRIRSGPLGAAAPMGNVTQKTVFPQEQT